MNKKVLFRWALGLVGALMLTVALMSNALADSQPVHLTINGGLFSEVMSPPVGPLPITLNGHDQTTTYTDAIDTIDERGTSAGWNLTVTSTQFSDGATPTPHTLPTDASSINSIPTATCVAGITCVPPTHNTSPVAYPVTIPAGAAPPTSVKFFNVDANSGEGEFIITPTVTITIPATTFAATYTSTVTVALVSGP